MNRVTRSAIDWHRELGTFTIPAGSPVELVARSTGQRNYDSGYTSEYLVTPTAAIRAIVGEFYWSDFVHYGCRVHESETEVLSGVTA